MASRNPFLWRGVIRGTTRGLSRRCDSLLNYAKRHTNPAFLDAEEEATLKATITLCDRILSDRVFPPTVLRSQGPAVSPAV